MDLLGGIHRHMWRTAEQLAKANLKEANSTFETRQEIISLKASSIRTSILEWYCCCGYVHIIHGLLIKRDGLQHRYK